MLATVFGLALQQEYQGEGAGVLGGAIGCVFSLVWIALAVLVIAGLWKVFTKAGKPGWAAIIPIYNIIVLLEIVGKPLWWIVLFIIPLVNIVAAILVNVALAEKFGKGIGFAIGLILLPIVFIPVLGFGSATYRG